MCVLRSNRSPKNLIGTAAMRSQDQQVASFEDFLGRHISDQRHDLTVLWVDMLRREMDPEAGHMPPSDVLLTHIPVVLEGIADFVADPEAEALGVQVGKDLARLADLRRRQGFGLQEVLREYHMLCELLQRAVEEAASEYAGEPEPTSVVRAVARMMESVQAIGAVTTRSYRRWRDLFEREWHDLLEMYGQMVSHELGNRLGAAETAIQLLRSPMPIDEDRRARLYDVILRSIQGGLETIRDLDGLARPLTEEAEPRGLSLWLLARESVRLASSPAEVSGVSVTLEGEVPDVRVPGWPVRIALANLLSNAVKYHRDHGADRWVRVSARWEEESGMVEITVEDNGPGVPEDTVEKVFEYEFRGDVSKDGCGLGLAITREVIDRIGGSVSLRGGSEGGALFTVRVPQVSQEPEPL